MYWKRSPNVDFDWNSGTEGSEHLIYILQGETLMRLDFYARPWATDTFPGGILTDASLLTPYAWGLLVDDNTFPNPTIQYPLSEAANLPNNWLHLERFVMRDGWTPPSYAAVNIGFTWDRVDCNFTTKARRHCPATSEFPWDIRFTWQAFSSAAGDPLFLTWRCGVSALFLGPEE